MFNAHSKDFIGKNLTYISYVPNTVLKNNLYLFGNFAGLNGKLQYSITSGDENQDFAIADNGTIYTAKHLDREMLPLYNLIVTARDSAKPPEPQLSSTVQVNSIFYIF